MNLILLNLKPKTTICQTKCKIENAKWQSLFKNSKIQTLKID